ncbi:MAG TPA: transposase, partial [Fimbriimonadaceae bacterium]|nr:transposase [Fimbriimonadaceae bacterium]
RRWVVERSFAWVARFRRLARDYERLPQTFAGLHWLAFITLMLSSLPDRAGLRCLRASHLLARRGRGSLCRV